MVIVCMGLGAMFALAVFIKPIEETMRWSCSGISPIALIKWLAMGVGSFAWGTLWQLYVTFGVATSPSRSCPAASASASSPTPRSSGG
jgi:hypothetical protein